VRRPRVRDVARLALAVLGAVLGSSLAACGPGASAQGAVPAAATGAAGPVSCRHLVVRPPAASGASVAVSVAHGAGGPLVVAPVCIGAQGPYPFVVDTGSPRSALDASLAAALHLRPTGGTVALGGSGCATVGTLVQVPALRVGPIAVVAQDMVRTSLASWSGRRVDGVLGSDVLGRFGAVKVDLERHTLSVAGVEGAAPATHALLEGGGAGSPGPSSAPVALASTSFQAPLTVVLAPGTFTPFVQATVAGAGPYAFVVDSGSPTSSLSATVGFTDRLPDQGRGGAPGGIGCSGTVHTLAPSALSVSSSAGPGPNPSAPAVTRTLRLRAVDVNGPLRSGMVGGVGLDWLGGSGAFVVDYSGATLSLGPG